MIRVDHTHVESCIKEQSKTPKTPKKKKKVQKGSYRDVSVAKNTLAADLSSGPSTHITAQSCLQLQVQGI